MPVDLDALDFSDPHVLAASLAKRRVLNQFADQQERRGGAGDSGAAERARAAAREIEQRVTGTPDDPDAVERAAEAERARQAQAGLDALKQRIHGGDAFSGDRATRRRQVAARAQQLAPLYFDPDQLKAAHRALEFGELRRVEARAFSSDVSQLPPQLWPNIIGVRHENRLLTWLPTALTELPVVRYIRHSSTTGAAAITAEGALKPELVFTPDHVDAAVQKISCHGAVSWEAINDHPDFVAYVQTQLVNYLIDVETAELLNGAGTTGHLTGFLTTSGILTHDASADTGTGVTVIDSIEKAIAQLRVGAALATADVLVLHPSTWSAIRRLKDTTGRFLFIASDSDPTQAQTDSIFGVQVVVTTSIAAGTGLLLDSTLFGRVLIRNPLVMMTGFANDDLVKNLTRFVLDERLTLAVERPAAVLAISNLPTS